MDEEEYFDDELLEEEVPVEQEPSLGDEIRDFAEDKISDYADDKIKDFVDNKIKSKKVDQPQAKTDLSPDVKAPQGGPKPGPQNSVSTGGNVPAGATPPAGTTPPVGATPPAGAVPAGTPPVTPAATQAASVGTGATGTSAAGTTVAASSTAAGTGAAGGTVAASSAAGGTVAASSAAGGTVAASASAGVGAVGGAAGGAAAGTGIGAFIAATWWIILIILGVILLVGGIVFAIIYFDVDTHVEEYEVAYSDANYNGNSLSYIKELEENTETSQTEDGDTCYMVELDGHTMVGPNFTNNHLENEDVNHVIVVKNWFDYFEEIKPSEKYILYPGECMPVEILDHLLITYIIYALEEPLDEILKDYDVELDLHERDALISLAYAEGTSHYAPLIEAYKSGSYEAMWEVMKDIGIEGSEEEQIRAMKRRKAEFALFVTGDYEDSIGNFYEDRGYTTDENGNQIEMSYEEYYEEYMNYDSENVIENVYTGLRIYNGNGDSSYIWPIGPAHASRGGANPGSNAAASYDNHVALDVNDPNLSYAEKHTMPAAQAVVVRLPIIAAKSGVVLAATCDSYCDSDCVDRGLCGRASSYGNYVLIQHEDGFTTRYAHLAPGTTQVQANQQVDQGQVIGYMGSTGTSSGPHLHFEISPSSNRNDRLDPCEYIMYPQCANLVWYS